MAFDDEEALPLLGQLVGGLVNIIEAEDEAAAEAIYVDELRVALPLELSIAADAHGQVTLSATPPSQHIETTVMPVWHTLRLRMVLDHDQQSTMES